MYDPIDFPEDTVALRDLTRDLVEKYQMPLEERILRGEQVADADYEPGRRAAKEAGLWGLALPEAHGGTNFSVFNQMAIIEVASWPLPALPLADPVPEALLAATGPLKEHYSDPFLAEQKHCCFAQTEPGGGSDPGRALRTEAVQDGDEWVINGTKAPVSGVAKADFVLVVAVTDAALRQRGGMSIFVVDMDNPGLKIGRKTTVLGGGTVHELFFDNCRVPHYAILGSAGGGFRQAQAMLSWTRLQVGAIALGVAWRALTMMAEYAQQREAFGSLLSEKQAVQGFIVDSWMEIHQARLALYNAAKRTDDGHDTRVEAAMVKVIGTEVCGRALDRAIQIHGAAGTTLDNPLAHWYGLQRLARIYEGPTEVHKYRVIARKLLAKH